MRTGRGSFRSSSATAYVDGASAEGRNSGSTHPRRKSSFPSRYSGQSTRVIRFRGRAMAPSPDLYPNPSEPSIAEHEVLKHSESFSETRIPTG